MNDKAKILTIRAIWLLGAMILSFLVIIFRLYYLQIFQSDKYTILSDDNRIATRILVPQRGIIYDRNKVALAYNVQNFQALIVPEQAKNLKETFEKFSEIVPLSDDEMKKIKKEIKRKRSFVPVKIKENLDWETVSKILVRSTEMPGIIIDEGLSRYYPYGPKAAHLLGYVGAVSENDMKENPLFGVPGFQVGKSGIEKLYEDKLIGKAGSLKLEVNAYGRIMKEIERKDGIKGNDIDLTIDVKLQEKAFDELGDNSGAAVVVDVDTGEIIAFVSTPAFDPNKMSQGIGNKDWQELLNNEKKPLTNKIISGQYSPGSTFKMITAIAALEDKVIKPLKKITCYGKMVLGSHPFHCWKQEGHGPLNMVEAIQHSCDIYFYEIALKTGIDKIAEVANRFGLGYITHVGFGGEKAGLMPNSAWKRAKFDDTWKGGESVIAGIGQGYILTTPMQLVMMTARIANNGKYVNPSFVELNQQEKNMIQSMEISDKNLDIIQRGMYAVVNEKHGTAYWSRFNLNGKKMAGKTGTTQVKRISLKERESGVIKQEDLPWKFRNHALFVGYAPYENPKYAIAVIVEHGGSGSGVAAPIASKILKEALILDEKREE